MSYSTCYFFMGSADAINYNICPIFLMLFVYILVLAYVNWRNPLQTSFKIAYLECGYRELTVVIRQRRGVINTFQYICKIARVVVL
jgi:hypothetical protein